MAQWYKWTVEIQVHKTWVEDGFELTNERAHSMLARTLPYANNAELKAKVISSPDPDAIAREQGYKDAADRKRREKGGAA